MAQIKTLTLFSVTTKCKLQISPFFQDKQISKLIQTGDLLPLKGFWND